ncbi:MAG: hypothetical protein GX621_10330 [Pirellulaceae bacterium]|nr:hypothetical protein [Pirellulaceae bacterium]
MVKQKRGKTAAGQGFAYVAASHVICPANGILIPAGDIVQPLADAADKLFRHVSHLLPVEPGRNTHCGHWSYGNRVSWAVAKTLAEDLLKTFRRQLDYGDGAEPTLHSVNLNPQQNCATRNLFIAATKLAAWLRNERPSDPGSIPSVPKSLFDEFENALSAVTFFCPKVEPAERRPASIDAEAGGKQAAVALGHRPTVNLEQRTVTLAGTTHDVKSEKALRWVNVLSEHVGEWISGPMLADYDDELMDARTDKLRAYLPASLLALIDSETGKGSRLRTMPPEA